MAKTNLREVLHKAVKDSMMAAMTSLGRDMRDDMRDIISRPVIKQGGHVWRSSPGESPYYEYGKLSRSMYYKVYDNSPTSETLLVSSEHPKGPISSYLEYGTERVSPRPHWRVLMRRVGSIEEELNRRFLAEMQKRGYGATAAKVALRSTGR